MKLTALTLALLFTFMLNAQTEIKRIKAEIKTAEGATLAACSMGAITAVFIGWGDKKGATNVEQTLPLIGFYFGVAAVSEIIANKKRKKWRHLQNNSLGDKL